MLETAEPRIEILDGMLSCPPGPPKPSLRSHLLQLVLRQWIEHRNPQNLRLHHAVNGVGWLALTTLLSQMPMPVAVPLLGANLGAWWTVACCLYFLPLDLLVPGLVLAVTALWSQLPGIPWGPGQGWLVGVFLPLLAFTAQGLTALFAHIYFHEHAEYLKDQPRGEAAAETTHAVFFGAFHFWLQGLLRGGYRPALRAEFEARERQAILRRAHVPWNNWAGNISARPALVCVPQTLEDLADVVRDAAAQQRQVRVVGSGFTWAGFSATDDVLVFSERLDRIEVDLSDPARPAVWAETGVTNRQLNAELARHGLVMPWNVVLETVRVGSIVSVGTHGSGRETATMGDLVEALDVIDANGNRRLLSEETVGAETMAAVRLGLGLFGLIARVRFRLVPDYRVEQVDSSELPEAVWATLAERVRRFDSVELYWFPHTPRIWVRTLARTEAALTASAHGIGFLLLNFLQMALLVSGGAAVRRFNERLMPRWMRFATFFLTYQRRVLPLADAQHYRRWIELQKCGCVEVGFKVDDACSQVRLAWDALQALNAEWAAEGKYPLSLTVNVRFVGPSEALLSPAYGEGMTCFIEALCAGRPDDWETFSGELAARWLQLPGALPHWAKEFEHVPGIVPLARERLGSRLDRFLAARAQTGLDPNQMFVNPLLRRLFLTDDATNETAPC